MKLHLFSIISVFTVLLVAGTPSWTKGTEAPDSPLPVTLSLDEIITIVERRYLSSGFSARFVQTSTIKAMDISDTATGKIFARPPGKMRWEYETPDPQLIISDGKHLWVYRPEDNQVMLGESPSFFGDGRGAGFLSDIKLIREKFDIYLEASEDPSLYLLKLIPRTDSPELSLIYLFIDRRNFNLVRVITYNAYEDETLVDFSDIRFDPDVDDGFFTFAVPEGTDIFQIDQ